MITLNGNQFPCPAETTVAALLKEAGFVFPLLVVRVNGDLVDRAEYASRAVRAGDTVEIMHLVSGG